MSNQSVLSEPEIAKTPEFKKAVISYAQPDEYAREELGLSLHPKQAAVLRDMFPNSGAAFIADPNKFPKKSRVSLKKANEVGGTRTVIAAAILYALDILEAEVISTAGKWSQVQTQLIPALKRFQHKFPTWDFQDGGIKINGTDRYIGFSTNSGFAQGYHKTEARPLVAIIDEAGLVDPGIFDDIEDRCNPDYFLAAGAPMEPAGKFYDINTKLAKFYTHHHISQMDCLTEHGYWIDRADIERKIAKYGSVEHPFIQSNIFGEFSSKIENGLLSLKDFNGCLASPPEWHPGIDNRHLFVDVGVNNMAALRHGNKITIHKRWTVSGQNEINQITAPIIRMALKLKEEIGLKSHEISVDGSGDYGKQVCDELNSMGWQVNRFYGQDKKVSDNDYLNRISEAWIGGCATIKACDIIIPDDDNFRQQCLTRKQRIGGAGKLQVEPKDEYMKRGFESPHEADAIFGAMMPVARTGSFNLTGLSEAEDSRGWRERARDEGYRPKNDEDFSDICPSLDCR